MNTPPQSRSGLLEDLKRRAEAVDQACKRSSEMERAFLEKKVLNREANEALEDFGRKRGQFGEYLLQRSDEIIAALSENRTQEGYPGIAHDFETMRSALVQIRDECFNGHAHDIAEAALNAAPQDSGRVGASQSHDPAVAAPASSERTQEPIRSFEEFSIVGVIRQIGIKAGVAPEVYGAMCHEVRAILAAQSAIEPHCPGWHRTTKAEYCEICGGTLARSEGAAKK